MPSAVQQCCLLVWTVLCVHTSMTHGQVPTFDKSPCVDDIYAEPGSASFVEGIVWVIPSAKDQNKKPAAVTCDKDVGTDKFEAGSTVVTCTAVDTSDRALTAECSFTIHVFPKFTVGCPSPIIQNDTEAYFDTPTAVGSGGKSVDVLCNTKSGDPLSDPLTTVTCTATDTDRNLNASCSFTVTIGIPPTFDLSPNCEESYNVAPTAGKNEAEVVSWPERTAKDASGGVANVECKPASGATFSGGETNVTCTAQDSSISTLITTCDFKVRVYPIFTTGCPAAIVQANGSAVDFPMPVATDSVGTAPDVTCDYNPGNGFAEGVTAVTCSANDSVQAGQSVSCSFNVTIGKAPIFDPDPDCTRDFIVSPNDGIDASNVDYPERTATQADNTKATVQCEPASGTRFQGGDTNVTCSATDTNVPTLITTCSFKVRVYPKFENVCPEFINQVPDPDDYVATVAFLNPTAIDKDGNEVTVTCDPPSGSQFEGTKTTVECIAEQSATENATCVTSVGVVPALSNPVQDIDQGPDLGQQTAVVSWNLPTSTLPGDQQGEVKCTPESGFTFPPGETDVKCVAPYELPVSGTVVEAINFFKVRVYPIITCPSDVIATPDDSPPTTPVEYQKATAVGSMESEISVTCEPDVGSEFPNNNATKVTCNTTDPVTGNEATCSFLVTVGEVPTFNATPCHDQVNVPPDPYGSTASKVSWEDPTAVDSDNNVVDVTCEPVSGTTDFDAGATEVTCTAVDGTLDSLINTCKFDVFVSPTFNVSCSDDLVVKGSEAVVSPDWLRAKGNTDTTGELAVVECDREAGSVLAENVTVITCTATDAGTSFTTNCSFTVTVDAEPPTMDCPSGTSLPVDPGKNTATYTWTVNVTDDNPPADGLTALCIPPSGSIFEYGMTEVICSAVDVANNIGTCTFEVNVTSTECSPNNCTDNSNCIIDESGQAECRCREGFSGIPCENINECEVDKPCHTNADCKDLKPPEFFSCTCKEGFYGDGIDSCERYIEPEYPDIPGSVDFEKKFALELAISNSSTYGCDPENENDKMSPQCFGLVNIFKGLIEPLYRQVSSSSFKAIIVDQSAIKKGSVVIPHTVTYNYGNVEVRGIGSAEFLRKSTLATLLKAGAIGSLELQDCAECGNPKDVTDVCTGVDKNGITCTGKRVLYEEKSSDHCILKCVSTCVAEPKYCAAGVCTQELDKEAVCSDCPEGTEGPKCEEVGPNIPLIVGLSVGLGGGALLIIIIIIAYFMYKNKTSKSTALSDLPGGNSRSVEALQMQDKRDSF
ncbi:hyalin-like [Acanthaster planci]|uniref:Hyalin-like n=1 Tax=Acanthaster planci TaxID=133434 RepID=A0A8B7XEL6_ACAPL|nr:hyalin-like [Acanthaster planci]